MITYRELKEALPNPYAIKQLYCYKNIVYYDSGKAIHVLSVKRSSTIGVYFISDSILKKNNLLEFKSVYKICTDKKALVDEISKLDIIHL